jgi:trigger factor
MDVKEISRDGLLRKYLITVSPEETKIALDEAARGLVSQVTLPGFRAGKVPLSIIKSRFEDTLQGELMDKFAKAGMSQALENQEKDTLMMGAPSLSPQGFSEADGVTIELEYEVFPKMPDIDLTKIQLKKYNADCSEEVLKKEISALQAAHSRLKPLDGLTIKAGNIVLCDWEILSTDGTRLEKGTDYVEVTDSPSLGIAGFGKHLIDSHVNETKHFEVVLPEDHFIKDHVGRQVKCTATIKNVFEKITPSVEELVKLFEYDTLETFSAAVQALIETRINTCSKAMLEHDLMDHIKPLLVDMELPQRALREEIQNMKEQLARAAKSNARIAEELTDDIDAKIDAEAKQRLRSSIFLGYLSRVENIDATQAELSDYIKLQPQGVKMRPLKDMTPQEVEHIRNKVITTKVLDSLLNKTEVQENTVPFDEFCKLYQKSFY